MRLPVTIALCAALACLGARADTIHLKNGRSIPADHVRENGNHFEYDIGDDSYAIPKSLVDHVDAGGAPPVTSSASAKNAEALPVFTAVDSLANEGDLVAKIVRESKVDSDAVSALEAKGNPELGATANFIAGKQRARRGQRCLHRGSQGRRHLSDGPDRRHGVQRHCPVVRPAVGRRRGLRRRRRPRRRPAPKLSGRRHRVADRDLGLRRTSTRAGSSMAGT